MPRIPIIKAEKLIKILKKNGFDEFRSKGSHRIFVNRVKHLTVSVPAHRGRDLGRGITLAILKDAEIPVTQL